ncbi:unnamed protein product [Mytilus coruscus]|uniref:C1q domain-containing protein n=1 Tax=Mytilus coruscus TaxID=42192 RepID=A0A6J8D0J7_MYTCO|nr:unnamed protein product [Mytilus coruscus]
MTGVKQDIATLRKEMEERVIREILEKLGSLARTVSTENKVMNEKLDGETATVNGMNLRVALSACVPSDYYAGPSTTIQFSDIKTSEGITNQHLTSFNSSGVFVCEVPGLYHISVVVNTNTNYASFIISKNDKELIKGNNNNYNKEYVQYSQSNAAIVVTELQKGDSINIKPGKYMRIHGNSYSCLTIVKVK